MLKQQGPSVINIIMFKLKQNNMEQEEGTGWAPASGQTILSLSWLPRRALIFLWPGDFAAQLTKLTQIIHVPSQALRMCGVYNVGAEERQETEVERDSVTSP